MSTSSNDDKSLKREQTTHFEEHSARPHFDRPALQRQLSIQLTPEQFSQLYLSPGGQAPKGDLAKRLGNPTPLGLASFLMCLTPFSCQLMGWAGTSTKGAVVSVGAAYFVGGFGLIRPSSSRLEDSGPPSDSCYNLFVSFGGFWAAFGFLLQPTQQIADSVSAKELNGSMAMYLLPWTVLVLVYGISALRTNIVFVALFGVLEIVFILLVALYLRLAYGYEDNVTLTKSAGGVAFVVVALGWYLLVGLLFDAGGIPIKLPVGDLSNSFAGEQKARTA